MRPGPWLGSDTAGIVRSALADEPQAELTYSLFRTMPFSATATAKRRAC